MEYSQEHLALMLVIIGLVIAFVIRAWDMIVTFALVMLAAWAINYLVQSFPHF